MLPSRIEELELMKLKEEIKSVRLTDLKLASRVFETPLELFDYFYRLNRNEKPYAYRLVETDRILKEINLKVIIFINLRDIII